MSARPLLREICLLLLTALLAAAPLEAQENRVGLVGGITYATIGGDDSGDADSTLGFDVGAYLSWALNESWALRPGLYYVQKGAEDTDGTTDIELGLDYVEFPVLLEYRIPTEGAVGVQLFGGPAVAFEVGCEIEASDGTTTVTADCDDPLFDGGLATSSVDFGLMLGAGLEFDVSESADLVLQVSYNLGLTSIDDSGGDNDVKNRVFQINAGISFPVGR